VPVPLSATVFAAGVVPTVRVWLALSLVEVKPIDPSAAKDAVNSAFELSLSAGLELERRNFFLLFATDDQSEGMAAFGRSAPAMQQGEIVPRSQDFKTIGHLYRSIEAGIAHLADKFGERRLFVGPPRAQATQQYFHWPELVTVTDVASAQQAIDEILEQVFPSAPPVNGARMAARAWTDPVKTFVCPSRRLAVALPAQNDDRGVYQGGGWAWGKTDYAADALVVPNRGLPLWFMAAITDGTSHTILAGEKAVDPHYAATGSWYWDEPFFLGGSDSTSRKGNVLVRDQPGDFLEARENWGSAHPAGVQFPVQVRAREGTQAERRIDQGGERHALLGLGGDGERQQPGCNAGQRRQSGKPSRHRVPRLHDPSAARASRLMP